MRWSKRTAAAKLAARVNSCEDHSEDANYSSSENEVTDTGSCTCEAGHKRKYSTGHQAHEQGV